METKLSGRIGGDRDYDDVKDRNGSDNLMPMKDWPRQGSGHSGANAPYKMQDDAMFSSNEEGFENRGALGAMPFKEVGDMAMHEYGADLSPSATNTIEKFDAGSDSEDGKVGPRPGGANFRF